MKELSIEEKAKAYDEALRYAMIYYKEGNEDMKMMMKTCFPALVEESEDERIRKAIIEYLRQRLDRSPSIPAAIGSWIAWLEKQGKSSDQIHYWTEEEIEPIISDYLRGAEHYGGMIGRLRCLKPKSLEKQGEKQQKTQIWKHWKDGIMGNGEGKPIYLIKYGHTYSLSSCLCFECDYIKLSELNNLTLEKQGTSYTKRDVDDAYVEGMAFAKDELEKQIEPSIKWNKNTEGNKPQVNHSVLMKTTHGIAEGEWQGEYWHQYRWAGIVRDSDVLSWMELSDLEKQGEQKPTDKDMIEALRTEYEKGRADVIADTLSWLENCWPRYCSNQTIIEGFKEAIKD